MKFRFKIDEKSLFYGMYNDYARGQTATISTPINQSKDPKKWHNDILKLFDSNLEAKNVPEMLVNKCLNNTTSQAKTKLVSFYEFSNIYIDGKPLETTSSFAMYIKEEVSDKIIKRDGSIGKNTHLGRIKLHYPITLKYKTDGFNVDNKAVLEAILNQNGGFAYIVRGFECDTDNQTLNILTSMVGLKGIFLSSVFKRQKGVGRKLLLNEIDPEAQEIAIDYDILIASVSSKGFDQEYFDKLSKSRVENGKIGEKYVFDNIKEIINEYVDDVYHTSLDYPTSPYDIEYTENGIKKFVEVKSTSTDKKVFNMSSGEIKFMTKYKEDYTLVLVTEVKEKFPKVKVFHYDDIMKLRKEYPSTRFYA